MGIKIQRVRAQDTYTLRHQVMWPDKPEEFVQLPNDQNGVHLGLLKEGEVISVVSLFVTDKHGQFRKFATKTSEQGNGYGSLLLKHLMNMARNEKIETLWCNARADKAGFYERFGMTQTPKRFIRESVHYVVMEKTFV